MTEESTNGLSKEILLSRIRKSHSGLFDFVVNLDPSSLLESQEDERWTIKDILAHVMAWEEVLIRFHIQGEPFDRVVGIEDAQYWVISDDELNEHFYQRYRDWPVDKVLKSARDTHGALIEILEELPADRLRNPPAHSKGEPQSQSPLLNYVIGNTYDHYEEHLASVRQIAAQSKE